MEVQRARAPDRRQSEHDQTALEPNRGQLEHEPAALEPRSRALDLDQRALEADVRPTAPELDRGALEADLRRHVAGEVRFDRMSRLLYASDASNYQIEPLGVVRPRDADDVAALVSVCAAHGAPIVPRAGGSSLAGQCLGAGVVVDVSAHLHALSIDPEQRVARVEAGVVLDRLNRAAAAHGLTFGPDPASAERACMGGVVATNATGAHSGRYGMTADHVRAVDVVLVDGTRARLAPCDRAALPACVAAGGLEGRIWTELERLSDEAAEAVARDFPRYWRRAGGYNLDRLVHTAAESGPIDAAQVFAGSEGTLAVATSFELALVPLPAIRALLVAHFDAALDPFRAVPALLASGAAAVELVDRTLLDLVRNAPGYAADLALVHGQPEALLIVEYPGATIDEVRAGLTAGERALRAGGFGGPFVRAEDPAAQAAIWRVRKVGLGILLGMRGDWKPVAGVEDTAVPPDALADYMADVHRLMADHDVRAAYYAHAGTGCIHVRPILNLKSAAGVATLASLAEGMFELVTRHGGVNASEHGDGLARGAFNRRHFGAAAYGLFERLKAAFDPAGILNPGKIVGTPPLTEHLRYRPGAAAVALAARFAYPLDGDIAHAVEQCNGAGVCRKLDFGAMCPSYMVTLDEAHTTRARANALRAVLDGRLPPDAMASDEVAAVFDLCVGCKACQTECPSGVDMARLKIEVLAARNAARGTPVATQLFGRIHDVDRLIAPAAPLVNRVMSGPLWPLGARLLGLAPTRRFPAIAGETFDQWWSRRGRGAGSVPEATNRSGPMAWDHRGDTRRAASSPVVLFADTFATYNEPKIGRAAVAVLEAAGFHVIVPPRACCGRPALSQGMVDVAVRGMRANVRVLAPLARAGLAIVVPEPSCASAFRDEMPDLLTRDDEHDDACAVAAAVRTLDEFVAALPPGALQVRAGPNRALLHVHCHQRAHCGAAASIAVLRLVPGLAVEEPDAGCCGMAGAFGFKADHYAVSLAMAERRLAPAVRRQADDCLIVAPGTSCRQQIADTTGRQARHPIEVLAMQLDVGGAPQPAS